MFVATVVLSGLLAFVFGAGAVGKLAGMRSQVETAAKLRIAWSRYRLIALPEAAAAVGLVAGLAVAPLGVAAAVGLRGDVNATSQTGDTALHVAAALGHDTVVQLLVERGTRVTVKNKRGITPLVAAMSGSIVGRGRAAAPAGD